MTFTKFPQTKVVTTAKELKWRVDHWRVDTKEELKKRFDEVWDKKHDGVREEALELIIEELLEALK